MNCYVLIGGRSSRMGRSKTALFLDRVVTAARPVFDDVLAVQRAGGDPFSGVKTIFEDAHEGEAPIFGVATALRHAHAAAFILAVDYPLITSPVLELIRDRRGVPVWNGQPQHLCAVWEVEFLPQLERRIAEGRFDLRGLLEHAIIAEEEVRRTFGGEPLLNVNTPEELQAAEKIDGW